MVLTFMFLNTPHNFLLQEAHSPSQDVSSQRIVIICSCQTEPRLEFHNFYLLLGVFSATQIPCRQVAATLAVGVLLGLIEYLHHIDQAQASWQQRDA
jgi:hypothetical protein